MIETHARVLDTQPDSTGSFTPPPSSQRRLPGLSPLFALQLFLGAGWFRAGVEKIIDRDWWSGAVLDEFLDVQRPHMLPFFTWFADNAIAPLSTLVVIVVIEMQLAIAAALLTGRFLRTALWMAVGLNLIFVLAGRVNPSAFYLVMQLVLLVALARPTTVKTAFRRAALWFVPALLILPFARTLHPAYVIDDPALMISFLSALAAISTLAPHRHEIHERTLRIPIAGRLAHRIRVMRPAP